MARTSPPMNGKFSLASISILSIHPIVYITRLAATFCEKKKIIIKKKKIKKNKNKKTYIYIYIYIYILRLKTKQKTTTGLTKNRIY